MGPPAGPQRPWHLAARRALRRLQPPAARERRLHRAVEPGPRLPRPAARDRAHAGDHRRRSRMERRAGARSRARVARRGARAMARRLAEPRQRALSRALFSALRRAGAGFRLLGCAQAQGQRREGVDQGRPRTSEHAALPARARRGRGDVRPGLPLQWSFERDEEAPVLGEGSGRLENHLRRTRMKLSHLFALSAAAMVPAGALAANPQVDLRTNLGSIRLELYPAKAPKSVENFLQYVKEGQYDGTVFHRVIPGFMIQGGGFDKDFRHKKTRSPIANEAQGAVKAGLKNDSGTIAMARTADPNSATAQFFINVNDNSFLNWGDPRSDGNGYAVFGKVGSGMDVVNKIAKLPTGAGGPFPRDVPKQPVLIESATVVEPKSK